MSAAAGPDIIQDGLVLCLDAGNRASYSSVGTAWNDLTKPDASLSVVQVLVVAGGGGGGGVIGGGGGAGGFREQTAFSITPGSAITVTVGDGGSGGFSWNSGSQRGNPGTDSIFSTITATGGGGGGAHGSADVRLNGTTGGSGGGGGQGAGSTGNTPSTTPSQGNSGGTGDGNNGGGGGGSSANGETRVAGVRGGNGGNGISSSISGTLVTYAGGGGGGTRSGYGVGGTGGSGGGGNGGTTDFSRTSTHGGANTGGGGGGGGHNGSGAGAVQSGSNGGSGIVIVRYPGPQKATGGTVTPVGGDTVHTFTTSGTFTPNLLPGTGILTNGIGFNAANVGSLVFDGVNDYVDIGNPTSLQSLTQGSIEAFYYRTASTATYQMIFTDVNSDLEVTYATNTLQFYIGNSGIGYSHAITGQWFHVVGVWGVGFKRLYLNGAQVASGTNTGLNTGSRVRYIGSRAGGLPLNGFIPTIRVYNRTLTEAEILQNYNATKGRFLL
jgi:hypothetical protein